jgi:hypothetical protein
MSSIRQSLTPLLERRALEITKLRAEVTQLKETVAERDARIAKLEAELAAAKKKK